jgi:hypothetical protein
MDERQKMQVENLREYLKLYHQLLLLLITLSATFFLFSWRFEETRKIQFHDTDIPMNLAWLGALILFVCFAGFARATLNRAENLIGQLKSSDLRDVILQYPSVATDRSVLVRLGSVALPMILVLGGVGMEFVRESASSGQHDWSFVGVVAFFVLLPTASIFRRVMHPLGSR